MSKTIKELQVENRNLRYALESLLDEYLQYADNACHCDMYEEYDEDEESEQLCPYCYAKQVLKK